MSCAFLPRYAATRQISMTATGSCSWPWSRNSRPQPCADGSTGLAAKGNETGCLFLSPKRFHTEGEEQKQDGAATIGDPPAEGKLLPGCADSRYQRNA